MQADFGVLSPKHWLNCFDYQPATAFLSRRQVPAFVQYSAAFDADKTLLIARSHIGHVGGFLRTGIPGHHAGALFLVDANAGLTFNHHRGLNGGEYPIHFAGKCQGAVLVFPGMAFQIVQIVAARQYRNGHFGLGRYRKVAV